MRFLPLFCLLLLASCLTPTAHQLPNWYLTPPANDANYLYGAGSGGNVDDAKKSALSAIAEQLKVTISSSFDLSRRESTVNDNSIYSENSKQKILSKVEQIEFNNFAVKDSASFNKQVYLLVAVDKPRLIEHYESLLGELEQKMANLYTNQQGKFILERKIAFTKIADLALTARNYAYLLDTLEAPNFRLKNHLKTYDKYANENAILTSQLKIYIKYSPENKQIATVLRDNLNKAGIKTIPSTTLDVNLAVLDLTSRKTHQTISEFYYVKINLNLTLRKGDGTSFTSTSHEITGNSAINQRAAFNTAMFNLQNKIAEKGILQYLNIEKNHE
jgi:hypothetical protein